MIGKVSGLLDSLGPDHALIDVGGVGYVVHCSDRTLATMPAPGGAVALYTDLIVREDLLQLVGFRTLAERELHRLLTSVQGVGAKAGLAILGTLGAEGVARALSLGDVAAIRAAPGIGPKLAQRVVLELRAKAPAILAMGGAGSAAATPSAPAPATKPRSRRPAAAAPEGATEADVAAEAASRATAEALSALVNLGYGEGEAAAAVAGVAGDATSPGRGTADLIRAALRALAPKG